MTPREHAIAWYKLYLGSAAREGLEWEAERTLCRRDLFYLLTVALGRVDVNHDWLFARCREFEKDPYGYVDLWARDHYKSTIATFGHTIQEILRDPEDTLCIMSVTRPIAKQFLRQIKREFEANAKLRVLFPETIWENPQRDAPKWSEDDGIIVNRRGNPKESTIEAWGLVDAQPTSKHFRKIKYDDAVTAESVTTPEMIAKVVRSWETSLALLAEGGERGYTGTRWHHADLYKTIIERGAAIERRHAATIDGTEDGEPVFLTRESLAEKRRMMGPYTFGCLPADAPILMADGSEKPIGKIEAGDRVVGFTICDYPARGKYIATEVKAAGCIGEKQIVAYELADGFKIECTVDHKWFTGRKEDGRSLYSALGLSNYHGRKIVNRLYEPRPCPDERSAAWLGGIYDGEGTTSGGALCISQSPEHNPEICEAIENAFDVLNLPYGTHERAAGVYAGRNHKAGRTYYLNDGRQAKIDFVRFCRPVKARRIMERVVLRGRRSRHVRVVAAEAKSTVPVFGIETGTGNYIAYGLLSKNSQMLLNPTAGHAQGFKEDWLRYHQEPGDGSAMNKYILGDAASEKKKNSDYTALGVVGLGSDNNYYILDLVRDRLNLTERGDALFALHRRWKPMGVGYESYGLMADIEYFRDRMRRENYHFEITKVGGQMPKPDRIKRLVPTFEQGRMYLPETCGKVDYEGKWYDLVQSFLNDEYRAFPVPAHDDMLDMLSRIFDIETVWPRAAVQAGDRYTRAHPPRRGRSQWAA